LKKRGEKNLSIPENRGKFDDVMRGGGVNGGAGGKCGISFGRLDKPKQSSKSSKIIYFRKERDVIFVSKYILGRKSGF
jgi:hypothetical protein